MLEAVVENIFRHSLKFTLRQNGTSRTWFSNEYCSFELYFGLSSERKWQSMIIVTNLMFQKQSDFVPFGKSNPIIERSRRRSSSDAPLVSLPGRTSIKLCDQLGASFSDQASLGSHHVWWDFPNLCHELREADLNFLFASFEMISDLTNLYWTVRSAARGTWRAACDSGENGAARGGKNWIVQLHSAYHS